VICGSFDCLTDNVIGKCFDDCGKLVVGVECILFQALSGGTYVLDNLGGFQVGDFVRVTGLLNPNCATFCLQGNGCIQMNTIEKCEFFEGCGTLQVGPQSCTLFVPDDGNQGYVLQNEGGFTIGDHVFVQGPVTTGLPTCFPVSVPLIENDEITLCDDEFAGCGTIVGIPFCGLGLHADVGGFYLLNDTGGFRQGDHVFVKGTLIEACIVIPECQAGACIDVKTIEPCGVSWFSGCGVVVIPFACDVAIAADDGSGLFTLTGPLAARPPLNQHVFIEGPIDTECESGIGDCPCVEVVSWSICIVEGDLDEDGDVDGADLGLLLSAWGPCPIFQVGCPGDLDFDGDVDGADLGIQLTNWTG
jgi:hypothetical protein